MSLQDLRNFEQRLPGLKMLRTLRTESHFFLIRTLRLILSLPLYSLHLQCPKCFFHQVLINCGRNILGPTPSIEMEITPFPFLDLPSEIRNQIYGFVLPSGRVSNYDTPTSCSTKHSESISLSYSPIVRSTVKLWIFYTPKQILLLEYTAGPAILTF